MNCFSKCEADHRANLRGRHQVVLDDSDVHHHRHAKAAVGGPAVFVSVDAMPRAPRGLRAVAIVALGA